MKAANLQFTGVTKSDVHVCQSRQRTMRKAGSEQENREWGTWGGPREQVHLGGQPLVSPSRM